ncbi:glycoside hydrolase superfamily [Dactylonectria macrodidyma]|uniref:Glycoside hydrolase superfamily n=1 Tax=Dactylonectria macrodidyma TaxID=307937 RepID=A0A9P9IS80_9HYPO|nr:glycoside hydrolase superfamily [Dactylonectria macrodidyma]
MAPSHLLAATIAPRQDIAGTATVDLSKGTGDASFLGSGFIYGFPDNGSDAGNSIPDHFITDIKFRTCRAGGAQISAAGWATGGEEGYKGRFESTLSNYRTTRKYNGDFILLPHDIWGAQGGATESFPFPGDNGDWSQMEAFIRRLISDVKANNMLDGLVIDLWNEPDLDSFWNRPWSQYVEYFVRASKILRAEFPKAIISGPSSAHSPHQDDNNWRFWMDSIAKNDVIPDIYSWHQIGAWEREPDTTIPAFKALRAEYSLPERPIDVNEYAWPDEQNPANSAYYLAQLERHNIRGLRANWGGGDNLHDYMGNLVAKSGQEYYANGEWQLYKYYANMVGERLATSASSDLKFDAFAVLSNKHLKILAGTRTIKDRYDITITGFGEIGLPDQGTLEVHRYQFDWDGPQGRIYDALDLGSFPYYYSSNQLTIPHDPPTGTTAFAYEIKFA